MNLTPNQKRTERLCKEIHAFTKSLYAGSDLKAKALLEWLQHQSLVQNTKELSVERTARVFVYQILGQMVADRLGGK